MAFKWMSIENLEQDMLSYPENYTFWFKLIIENTETNSHRISNEGL